ncbi:M20/M25/M40 family metallo-hydrolase, partial [Arthrobacter sp. zg-Y1219]|uniref:M20/M25/M40 family metallo-hydrolase n=1 Tax=Arthrobacter sp. zg-Y1219 TaxID=3049067 RepID=UPI0024C27039
MISYIVTPHTGEAVEARMASPDTGERDLRWCGLGDRIIWWQDSPVRAFPDELLRQADTPGWSGEGSLYLIGQAGNSFLAEFHDVQVAVNKGRYLIVTLTAGEHAEVVNASGACFGICPVPENAQALATLSPAPGRAEAAVSAITALVSEDELINSCTVLAGFHTRHSLSTEFSVAVDWAMARLQSFGFDVTRQAITLGSSTSFNLVADRPGSGASRRLVMATAHLDSINIEGGAGALAPGADDNASGAAGLMEIGRVLGRQSYEHDLRLILFGGEEQGLHGSRQYVAALSQTDRGRLDAVINMDMISTLNVPQPTVLLEGAPVSQQLMVDLTGAAGVYTTLSVQTSLNPFASDHVPFINAGLPALLTIEGADSANFNIHTSNDTLDKIDGALAAAIVRMNVAVLAAKLHAEVVPGVSSAGPDLTGDRKGDIIGFGDGGVWASLNNGDGTFKAPARVVDNFAYTAGDWRVEKHPRFLADLTGDGRADIIGFGDGGVWVSLNNGDGTFKAPARVVDNFAYTAGDWRVEKHPRFLADLTGDG